MRKYWNDREGAPVKCDSYSGLLYCCTEKVQSKYSAHRLRLMGPTTVERELGCVRDYYLEGARSKILRCAIAASTSIPRIKNIERKNGYNGRLYHGTE